MSRSWRIGEIEVHVLVDGVDRVPPETILVAAPEQELAAIVEGHTDDEGQLPVAYNSLLLRADRRLVLIDAGSGESGEQDGTGGRLLRELATLGISPSDIDDVVISHCHADHIGGLTTLAEVEPAPTYPLARHWFWQDEWTYWTSEDSLAALPAYLADAPRASLPALDRAGLVQLVDREQEVAPGVRIVPAAGHTPGHVVVAIESAGERAMYLGDAVFHPVNVGHPAWGCVFDVDPEAAAATRHRLLDRAATEHGLVIAAHIAEPGRVLRAGRSYEFVVEA